jgi:hypothetical protein
MPRRADLGIRGWIRIIVLGTFFVLHLTAKASIRNDITQIGPHEPVFTFEKNENPQNIMVIYTKVDKECEFVAASKDQGNSFLDYYWLMDRKNFKPVNPMIKNGMRGRLEFAQSTKEKPSSFKVQINDLKELQTDLKDFTVEVKAVRDAQKACDVEALVKLGPSDHDRILRLQKIFSQAEKSVLPPFRKIQAITIEGKDVRTGEQVKRTYQARS